MLHLALEAEEDVFAVHQAIFQKFVDQMYPGEDNLEKTVIICKLEQVADAAEAMVLYSKYYLKAHMKLTDPLFERTAGKILQVLQYLY